MNRQLGETRKVNENTLDLDPIVTSFDMSIVQGTTRPVCTHVRLDGCQVAVSTRV